MGLSGSFWGARNVRGAQLDDWRAYALHVLCYATVSLNVLESKLLILARLFCNVHRHVHMDLTDVVNVKIMFS